MLALDVPIGERNRASLRDLFQLWDETTAQSLIDQLCYYRSAQPIVAYVLENVERKVRLEAAAEAANMQPSSVSRLFTDKIGIRFSDFVRVAKVAFAMRAIALYDYSIAELAYGLGYESPCTFTRVFKSVTGYSPGAYRRLYRNDQTRRFSRAIINRWHISRRIPAPTVRTYCEDV